MSHIHLPHPDEPDLLQQWTAQRLNEILDAGDRAREAITAAEWPAERSRRRELLRQVLVPDWERPDPCVTETGRIDRVVDGVRWTIHKLRFQSLPDYWVTALLYIPESAQYNVGTTPAVLLAQGHSELAKAYPEYHSLSEELCRQGMIVLAYDPPGQGERVMNWDWLRNRYDFGWGTREHDVFGMKALLCGWPSARAWVWDGMRALDVLLAQPQVDSTRIGMCGVSGGGTQTTWMLAADDRLTHAAPACYITSWREQFDAKLAADPEQHPFPVMAWGWDQADVLASFAPKPLMITAVTDDFFPIAGTRRTYKSLKSLYTRIGAPDAVTLSETPDVGHGYSPRVREATVRWFCEQFGTSFLGGIPARDILDGDALRVTPTGQLLTSEFTKTLHEIIVDTCRQPTNADTESLRTELRRLLGIPDALPPYSAQEVDRTEADFCVIERYLLEIEPEMSVPLLYARPSGELRGVALHVHEFGADTDWSQPAGRVASLLDAGWAVVSVDPRGVGASKSRVDSERVYHDRFGTEQHTVWTWQMLDRPLIGQRVLDVLQATQWIRDRDELQGLPIGAIGIGAGGVWAMLAAAIDSRIDRVVTLGTLYTYERILNGDDSEWPVSALVPGILAWGDMPRVAELILPRSVTIVAPTDEYRRPATAEAVRDAYRSASAGVRIIAAGQRPETLRAAYAEWFAV